MHGESSLSTIKVETLLRRSARLLLELGPRALRSTFQNEMLKTHLMAVLLLLSGQVQRGRIAVVIGEILLKLGLGGGVIFDLFQHLADRTHGARPLEFLVFDFHITRDFVDQTPITVEILLKAIALAIPLLAEETVCRLNVLDGER